jgi:tyrosine-protein kinase Etk/Wzc
MQMLKIDNNKVNIENEIEVLKSRTTMAKVIKALHINITYSITGRFKTTELYNNKPFELVIADTTDEWFGGKINVIDENSYSIIDESGKAHQGKWGDTITVFPRKIVLVKTASFSPAKLQYAVGICPVIVAARGYMYMIDISPPGKSASYITLSMQDNIPDRSIDIINKLMDIYMTSNVTNRNKISDSTIKFIRERIDNLFVELTGVEDSIVSFKQHNKIANMSEQSSQLVHANSNIIEKKDQEEVELKVMTAISDYLANAKDDKSLILPASLMDNAGLSALMEKFNSLEIDIENSMIANTADNPITKTLIVQKNEIKQQIVSTLASSKSETELKVQKINDELQHVNGLIQDVPSIERKYLDYARRQAVLQDLYTFLLKKREETAIQKSATVADANVIDPAINVGAIAKPLAYINDVFADRRSYSFRRHPAPPRVEHQGNQ